MKLKALAAAALLVVAAVPAGALAAGSSAEAKAYSQTYVSFETKENAVVDYAVNDRVVVQSVEVQSASKARSSAGVSVNADLSAVTNFTGAAVSLSATTQTQATVKTESGAKIKANDNDRGVLVVEAGGNEQIVRAGLAASAQAEQKSDSRVVVTKDDGTKAVFIATGDGEVTVNEEGNVTAHISGNEELVYRQYNDERSSSEKQQEQLIASGKAAATVYYQQAQSGSGKAVNVVKYGEQTTIETTQKTSSKLKMTVESSASEGKVVITSISKAAFESAENVQVKVDGEAAAKVDSYSKVAAVTESGVKESRYVVRSSSSAQASTDVIVGVGHFSKRSVTMTSGSGDDGSDGSDGGGTDTGQGGPGFGALAALAALGAALLARARL